MTRTAQPVFANAGVAAWYADQLQQHIVHPMYADMVATVREAWQEGGGIVHDAAVKYAAGALIRNTKTGLYLFLRRTDGLGYDLPGGGVEPGETPPEAVKRECVEEIGWVLFSPLHYFHTHLWRNVLYTVYTTETDEFVPVLNDEHDAAVWCTLAEAVKMPLHPGLRITLAAKPAMDGKPACDWIVARMDGRLEYHAVDAKPTTSVLLQRALANWVGTWTRRIETMSRRIAWDFAAKNRNATERAVMRTLVDSGFAVKVRPGAVSRQAFDAVVAENVGLIRTIPQKFLSDVQTMVWQSVMQGRNLEQLTADIQAKYGVAQRRAELIARDQNFKAKAAIEKARRLELGIDKAVWQHSHAGKEPRPTHLANDGKEYDIKQGWWDPAVQKFIWPGTEINCKCTDRAVIPGFT